MRAIDADALIVDCQLAQKQADRHGKEFANAFYSGGGEISTEWWCVEDMIENAPTIEPERKWSGLWSEPKNDSSVYGEKLMEGDTVYLLGVEGTVIYENGAWGWGSCNYVPWEELEKKMPHNNQPDFCYCDNFISFWELKWNFDDGYDWDGVPFIRHGMDMREDGESDEVD